jgi:hypothetical protein
LSGSKDAACTGGLKPIPEIIMFGLLLEIQWAGMPPVQETIAFQLPARNARCILTA